MKNGCPNIYIYCHTQTDPFVASQLFSVARHAGRLKLGSKPGQLHVRLSIRPIYIYIYIYVCLYWRHILSKMTEKAIELGFSFVVFFFLFASEISQMKMEVS